MAGLRQPGGDDSVHIVWVDDVHAAEFAEHVVDDVWIRRLRELRVLLVGLERREDLLRVVDEVENVGVFLARDHPVQP